MACVFICETKSSLLIILFITKASTIFRFKTNFQIKIQKTRNFVAFVQKTHKRINDFLKVFVQYIEFYLEKLLCLTLFNLFVIIQLCAIKNKP